MRYLILILCFLPFIGFSQIQLVGNITTFGGGSYPTHIDSLGYGGLTVVADATERDAITLLRRKVGMTVFQVSDKKLYYLDAPITENNWKPIEGDDLITLDTARTTIYCPNHGISLGAYEGDFLPMFACRGAQSDHVDSLQTYYAVSIPDPDSITIITHGLIYRPNHDLSDFIGKIVYLTNTVGVYDTIQGTVLSAIAVVIDSNYIDLLPRSVLQSDRELSVLILPAPFLNAYLGDSRMPQDTAVQRLATLYANVGLLKPGGKVITQTPAVSDNSIYGSSGANPVNPAMSWVWTGKRVIKDKELIVSIDLADTHYGGLNATPLDTVVLVDGVPTDTTVFEWLEDNVTNRGLRLPNGSLLYFGGTRQNPDYVWMVMDDISGNVSGSTRWSRLIKRVKQPPAIINNEIFWDFSLTVDTLTTSPGYANMDGAEAFYSVTGDTLFQVGGWKGTGLSHNEIWLSTNNGVTWIQAPDASWTDSHTFGFIKKDNAFYKIGSDVFDVAHLDEVWKSYDGLNWTIVTSTAEWGNRALFGTALRGDTMFVFGGQDTICNPIVFDDVWYSTNNGANWTQLCNNCLPEGGGHIWGNVSEYNGYFWVVGGELYNDCATRIRHKKVYKSRDGITWEYLGELPIDTETDTGLTYSKTFNWNGFLWMYSGVYRTSVSVQTRYLLYTKDGITWYDKTLPQLPATHAPALAVKNENAFLVTSGGGTLFNDVFRVDANRILVRVLNDNEVSRDTLNDELDGIYSRSDTVPSSISASITDSLSLGLLKIKQTQVTIGDNLSDSFREGLIVNGSIVLNQSTNNGILYLNRNRDMLLFNDLEGLRLGFSGVTTTTSNWAHFRFAGGGNKIYLGHTGGKGVITTLNKLHITAGTNKGTAVTNTPGIAVNSLSGFPRVGILDSVPILEAYLSIGAGTVNYIPFRLQAGVNRTSPIAGGVEWDGTNLFITQTTGPTRKTIAYTTDLGNYLPLTGGTLTGSLLFTDNTYDIGASGLTRPRTLYAGTSVISPLVNATTGIQINGAATTNRILKGNGTNFVASTETYAAPGSSGNVMTSDGTNWTSAAPAAAVVNLSLTGTSQTIELTNSAGTDVVFKGVDIGLTKVAGTKDTLYLTKIEHWGEVSISGGSTSVTAATPERPDNDTPGTPTASLSSEFTQSGSTVTYIGAAGQGEIKGTISFSPSATGDYLVSLYQEGVEVSVTEIRVTSTASEYTTVSVPTASVNIATNDTFELRIEPVSGSSTITIHKYNVYARKIY